jgi:phosphoesterase RecJ-like protein
MKEIDAKKCANDICTIVKRHRSFLITAHVRADGDALGSEVALYHALKDMGKSVVIVNDSPVPQIYKFIIPVNGMLIHPETPADKAEVVFALDCPTINRLGKVQEIIPKDAVMVNIDHHVGNDNFGVINWVNEEMCATGEIILSLLRKTNVTITPDIATALYVAIVTDTGRFTHANTTPESLKIAAFLMENGARHREISQYVYNTNSFNLIQLNACVLNTIKLHCGNKVATVWLTKDMLEKTRIEPIDTQEFADIPISIDGVWVGVLLREMTKPKWVKVSLRSRNGFDVNGVARKFGGGGHKYAAGCEIEGDISEVQQRILGELEKTLRQKAGQL